MWILFIDWNGYGREYIIEQFKRDGYEVELFPLCGREQSYRDNPEYEQTLKIKLQSKLYRFVFSQNYFPVISKACHLCGVKYVSWVYDSPRILLYTKYIRYIENYVFLFDKAEYQRFREQGIDTVYYLPLAAAVRTYDRIYPGSAERKRYGAEISFVGSAYEDNKTGMKTLFTNLDNQTQGYLDAVIMAQKQVYGADITEELLTKKITDKMQKVCPVPKEDDEWETDAWIYANYYVYREIAAKERKEILELLAEEHEVKLFTQDMELAWLNVINAGEADYEREMPLVFKSSKINLNISLRSIKTGIPLRVWDIMGCGGFVLTNYQEELFDFFEPDEDFVYYENYEDLKRKAEYYLTHDQEREQIARNAYEKVKRYHTYETRIKEMLKIVENEREQEIYNLIERIQQKRKQQDGQTWYRQFVPRDSLTKEELLKNTEHIYQKMEDEKQFVFALKSIILDEFDRLLQEGGETSYEMILRWMRTTVINEFCVFFSEFDYMAIFCDIYQMECLNGNELTFSHYQSVEELIKVFQQLSLLMRRVEWDFPEEEQEELFYYVIQNRISSIAFVRILEEAKINYKQKVLDKMRAWMEECHERG